MKCSWSCSCGGSVVVVEVVVVAWCSAVALVYLSVYLYIYECVCVFIVLSFCLSICLPIYLSVDLSIYLASYLSICLYRSIYLQVWRRSYSARLPQFLNLTMSKTKQFCETSATFELDNVKNEASLRDLLNFSSWQHPSIMESWVQSWRPGTNAVCNFSSPYL